MSKQSSEIDLQIWQVVALIPVGKVATYGDVARQAGLPGAARRVGLALRRLPSGTRVPWHRVLNSSGRISLPDRSVSNHRQRLRLEEEGLVFRGNGSLDLLRFRWLPGGH